MPNITILDYHKAVEKGRAYLTRNAKQFLSDTNVGIPFNDNFASLLLLELTGNRDLVSLNIPPRRWNYFGGVPIGTTRIYPDDMDTTSLGITILPPSSPDHAHAMMDEMLQYVNSDGIIQLYYDHTRPRTEPEVATNILTLFHTYNRAHDLHRTFEWIISVLGDRSWHREPNRANYYDFPEPFFYYLLRLIRATSSFYSSSPDTNIDINNATHTDAIHSTLIPLLKQRVIERLGKEEMSNPLCLSIRVLVCQALGIPGYEEDLKALMESQGDDGGWGIGWLCKYRKTQVQIGNRGVTAALAIRAIDGYIKDHHETPGTMEQ